MMNSAFWDFVWSPKIAAGRDSVWWFGPDGFFRLGDEQSHDWDEHGLVNANTDIGIALDGTLWIVDGSGALGSPSGLFAFDGASWANVQPKAVSVEIEEGGTVWAAWETANEKRRVVGRLIDGAWERLGGQLPRHEVCAADGGGIGCTGYVFGGLSLGDDGSPWVVTGGPPELFHHVGESWRRVSTPRGVPVWGAVAPDGRRWVQLRRKNNLVLARHDGEGWTVYDAPGTRYRQWGVPPNLRVAPDGSLWVNLVEGPNGPGDCRGVTRFDEDEPRHFLGDLCIHAMDVARDGKVWLQAGEVRDVDSMDQIYESLGPAHTYVITPEAVAAAE